MFHWEPEGRYRQRLCTVSDSTLLVLNRTSLTCINALLVLNWRYIHCCLAYFSRDRWQQMILEAWDAVHISGQNGTTVWTRLFPLVKSDSIDEQYAVKAQTSLAPLSRFRGSLVTTAHAHQCCRFQSYAKTVPSRMKLTSEIDKAWTTFLGSMTTDHVITACDIGL